MRARDGGWWTLAVVGLLATACATEGAEPSMTAAPARPVATAHDEGDARGASRPSPRVALRVVPVTADVGEDGGGRRIAATAPVAIELVADHWPGRATDPVLRIGPRHFHHYDHPAPGVLRFIVADRALLPAGEEVLLDHGDSVAGRVRIAPSLEAAP
jgi:hypothetical protein